MSKKVFVLGAGVLGLTSAYFLAKEGYDVSVFEEGSSSAEKSSFANGGQLSYSAVDPLASPHNLALAIKWLGRKNAPLLIRPIIDLDLYKWMAKWLINCLPSNVTTNRMATMKLSMYSKLVMARFRKEENIKFDFSKGGIVHTLDTLEQEKDLKSTFDYIQSHYDHKYSYYSSDDISHEEPSLKAIMKHKIGALKVKCDEVGDSHMFCQNMEKLLTKMGVKIIFNTKINTLTSHRDHITGMDTDKGFFSADLFVVCMGAYSAHPLKAIGVNTNIYPMKGYSITAHLNTTESFIDGSVYDHQNKLVYTRLGNRLRIAGTAEFNSYNHEIREDRIEPLLLHLNEDFPNACNLASVSKWACLRPQTPNSLPYIGKTHLNNLFLNTGHGMLGWTQCMGSSKLIADIISSKVPEINYEWFAPTNHS